MTHTTETLPAIDNVDPEIANDLGYDQVDPLDEPPGEEPFQRKLQRYKLRILRRLLSHAAGEQALSEIVAAKGACVLVVLPREWTEQYEAGISWLLHPDRTQDDIAKLTANARYYSSSRLIKDDQETVDRIAETIEQAARNGRVAFKVHKGTIDEVPSYLKAIFRYQLVLTPFIPDVLEDVLEDLTGSEKPSGLGWPDLKYVTPDHIAMAAATAADPWEISDFLRAAGEAGEKRFRELIEDLLRSRRRGAKAGPEPIYPTLRLETLHGMDEARAWAEDLIEDLTAYKAGDLPWSQVDRGALVHGQPGVGKTIFAQALAGSAGLPLILGSVMRWQSAGKGYLGDCLQAMRACFQQAIDHAPSILFIDEVDGFVDRDSLNGNGHEYWRQVTNALLELLYGVEGREGVVVVGACNNPAKVDPAIIRSGRLDRSVEIPLPDTEALKGILRYHLGNELDGENLTPIARMSQGSTGADVERWVRGARRRARKEKRPVAIEDLRAETGPVLPDYVLKNREVTAVHEIGHAILYELAWPGIVEEVRLLDRPVNGAWGWTKLKTKVPMMTRDDVEMNLVCLLGGRAAEVLFLGEQMSGSGLGGHSDLGRAAIAAALGEIEFDEKHRFVHLACASPEMISERLTRDGRLHELVQEKLIVAMETAQRDLQMCSEQFQVLEKTLLDLGRLDGANFVVLTNSSPERALHTRVPC
ncbi:AAA family ATPase [Hwanghaeella grinnelliae]|nr:AAA family ATPase [Hwanghaeella grinnelliae]